ncbi:glycoside hydrolase family 3 N-terminal domain-containing protein [Reichenbachiella versicolor]|uniref:glycoside hydrolase family 3 N-terminal domain-containing protein n=1 Tax=Reichenbachiella versicolor TaxID=1821036 RepID=UPI000D6E8D84|nr:glycoside hydrolase family 3 N-terminal domain-containing protein [Reichenbachiella versicolor]
MKICLTPILIGLSLAIVLAGCKEKSPSENPNKQSQLVEELIAEMSLEEKVGQMTQLTLSMFMTDQNELDIDKIRHAIVTKKVGSILNVNGRALSISEWHTLLNKIQDIATKETNLKIPILYGIDAIHGTSYTQDATLFPHNIGMAATRNVNLVGKISKITAMETRASGIRWNFDPALGAGRQPLWSRFEETFGESEHIAAEMGLSAIRAYEEDGLKSRTAVASCMKHFIGYSNPRSGKDRTPAYIPDIELREFYLPAFEEVAQYSSTAMINSGEINGMPLHGSKYYLQSILRDELGFEGLVVTDWEDIKRLFIRHKIASSPKEAVRIGINAGIDMSMVPSDYSFTDFLIELVNEGKVSMQTIDASVRRILKLKEDLGLFDNPYPEPEAVKNFGKKEYTQAALQAARESITLLKNNGGLPLSKKSKVLLMGPAANNKGCLHGSWSFTWQGDNENNYPASTKTLLDALKDKIGVESVISNAHTDFNHPSNTDISYLKSKATNSDVIVLALGEVSYAESPGGIDNLELDANQINLAKAAFKTGKPVIALLAQGRPRVISEIEPGLDGIVNLYRPASQGANATMDILFGDYNPSGKLPYTYQRNTGDILLYDRKGSDEFKEISPDVYAGGGYNPQWPFGHGLSYTDYKYDRLELNKSIISEGDKLKISLTIQNIGNMDGLHSVDLFIKDHYASISPSFMRLRKFQKVQLKKGESITVNFTVLPKDLSMINEVGDRVIEPGTFSIIIGDQIAEFQYQ